MTTLLHFSIKIDHTIIFTTVLVSNIYCIQYQQYFYINNKKTSEQRMFIFILLSLLLSNANCLNSFQIHTLHSSSQSQPSIIKSQVSPVKSVISLKIDREIYYYIDIHLGTPGQPQHVLIDTGSPWLWVPHSNSTTCAPGNQKTFNPNLSSSYVSSNRSSFIRYPRTRVQGAMGRDVVRVGGLEMEIEVLVVEKCVGVDSEAEFNGILGLINDKKEFNIFDLGWKSEKLVSSRFAFQFEEDPKKNSHIFYNFTDEDLPAAYYLPINKNSYWCFKLVGVYAESTKFPIKTACMDTGSPYIYFPISYFNKLIETYFSTRCFKTFPNTTSTAYNCLCSSKLSQFPQLSIENPINRFIITPGMYLQKLSDPGTCKLRLRGLNDPSTNNTIMLGPIFMRFYTTIFDKENSRIGFIPYLEEKEVSYIEEEIQWVLWVMIAGLTIGTLVGLGCFLWDCRRGVMVRDKLNLDAMIEMYTKNNEITHTSQSQSQNIQETKEVQETQENKQPNQTDN